MNEGVKKGGTVARALGVDAIRGLSFLLVLCLALRGFSSGYLTFPASQEPSILIRPQWNTLKRVLPKCYEGKQIKITIQLLQ